MKTDITPDDTMVSGDINLPADQCLCPQCGERTGLILLRNYLVPCWCGYDPDTRSPQEKLEADCLLGPIVRRKRRECEIDVAAREGLRRCGLTPRSLAAVGPERIRTWLALDNRHGIARINILAAWREQHA